MADKLSVTLEAPGADKAISDVQRFRREIVASDAQLNALATSGANVMRRDFSDAIATVQRQALGLSGQLRRIGDVTIGVRGLDGIGRAAGRAQEQARGIYARLREIERQAAVTRDPVLLRRLQGEASRASFELDKLQRKIDRVGAGRAARLPSAAGGPSGISGSAIGQVGSLLGIAGASEFGTLLGGTALSTGFLAVAAPIAAVGALIVNYSKEAREEAERRLKAELAVVEAVNRALIAQKEQLKDFREADALRQRQRQFEASFNDISDRDSLRRQAATLTQLRDLNPTGERAQQYDRDIQAIESRIASLDDRAKASADEAFNQRNENFKKSQEQARELDRKRLQSVNEGRQRVNEFGKTIDDLFANLLAKQGETNPFVRVFTEAEQSIKSVRIATSALSADLQKQAADMVAAANANALFGARLDSRLAAVNLRADAAAFRESGSTKAGDEIGNRALARFKRELSEGVFRNLDNLTVFWSGSDVSAKTALEIFDFQRRQERRGGLFRNPDFDAEQRAAIAARPENQTAGDRLDKQLAALRSLRPENEQQRGEIDRRIIALTQGLNPNDLTDAQRNAAAQARENEAVRQENAERDAKIERQQAAELQKSIDANIAELLRIAQKDGLTGVIRIINEAEDKATVSVGQRPTARDVTALNER